MFTTMQSVDSRSACACAGAGWGAARDGHRAGAGTRAGELPPGRQRGGRGRGAAHGRLRAEHDPRTSPRGVPSTAHILGGAVIGADAETGVVDARHRVFGYANLLICDGSVMPANPGVNPSLTITALAERAIAHVPAKDA